MSSEKYVTTSLAGEAFYDAEQKLRLSAKQDSDQVTMQRKLPLHQLTNAFCRHN
jgi:hypothetical protein